MVNNYYQNTNVKLEKEARETYKYLSEEEKEKRRKTARDKCQNRSEEG